MDLIWFKKDLRIQDHRPLAAASKGPGCLCVYVYEPEVITAPEHSVSHLKFLNESLRSLHESLSTIGSGLHVLIGKVPDVFDILLKTYRFNRIFSHEETGLNVTYERDVRVANWCRIRSISWVEFPQNGVVRALRSRDGWAKAWGAHMSRPAVQPKALPPAPFKPVFRLYDAAQFELDGLDKVNRQRGGTVEANLTLESFFAERGENYKTEMSSPLSGATSCSRISPYLSFGAISLRTVYQRLEYMRSARRAEMVKNWPGSLQSFGSRLRWHCHFMQKLESEPQIEFLNMNRGFDGMRPDFDEAKFLAFCRAETGYPMVDASLRYLYRTGWINFRMRAMLMSFCSYHLWLHWRRPAIHLAKHFLDFEPGIHYSQSQMQSGTTGINTVRIYSPIKQAVDQDPDGDFIRSEIPALRAVPKEFIPEPHKMTVIDQKLTGCRIGEDYPLPIVDHKIAYSEARDRIFQWRKRPEVIANSQLVQEKHGSRKPAAKRPG